VPIAYALSFPARIESGASRLDLLAGKDLSFEEADERRFPGLYLSWQALRAEEGATAVLNAANEEAVAAFLDRGLRFDQIHAINAGVLDEVHPEAGQYQSLEGLLALDARARQAARDRIAGLRA
jgi:1-deoxy-D-xylulose-5-phosphate reductoisomerase